MITALLLCSITYGQVATKGISAPVKGDPAQKTPANPSLKGNGDVFWSTTFGWRDASNPQGWSLPAGWGIVDEADLGNFWKWSEPGDSLGGCCSGTQTAPSHFVSRDDGYILVPADPYNNRDGITVTSEMNTHITTPPIDCSSKSSVVVKFNQYFRLCCNETFLLMLQVTNDNGVHWATYDCRFGMGANKITPLRYQSIEFNISDVAANLPNVQIRFYMQGPKYYFWMIDDLQLAEAYDNNLALEDYWADANVGAVDPVGNINYWPLSQMGMTDENGAKIGEYKFRGGILNMGKQDQEDQKLNMQIFRNGTEILNQNSPAKALWTLERDTLTLTDPFLATDYGDYQFKYTAVGDVTDESPKNNTSNVYFTVNDTLYHRADFTSEASSNGGGWVGGGNGGDMVGVGYDLTAPCEINSIYARIAGVTTSQNPQFQFSLFKYMAEGDEYVELINTDLVDATAEMVWTWQNLPVVKDGETEFLTPGFYIANVRMWGTADGDADGTNGISVGWDTDTKWSGSYSFLWRNVAATWWSIDKLNQIGIVINQTGAPTKSSVTFNVDMNLFIKAGEFNPGTDLVNVTGATPTWNATVAMADADGDGIYTATVDNLTVAGDLNYKYSINSKLEEYPMATNPNRIARVGYFNVFNDVYNYARPVFILNVDMNKQITAGTFIPGTDTVKVTGLVPIWPKKVNMTDTDGDGIYTYAVQGMPYNAAIDYKYSINSVPETFATRKVTLKYWNIRNDVFNEASSGVNPENLTSSFLVYPNPSTGSFNVSVTNTEATDFVITLTNINGQVVYQNTVKGVLTHQETIGNDLSKGMYFLSVNNGKEVKVQKVIVQ